MGVNETFFPSSSQQLQELVTRNARQVTKRQFVEKEKNHQK
jgi:hypothetical protein